MQGNHEGPNQKATSNEFCKFYFAGAIDNNRDNEDCTNQHDTTTWGPIPVRTAEMWKLSSRYATSHYSKPIVEG